MSNDIHQPSPASPAEDLAYIRRIMEDTRRAVTMHGNYFIIWGIAVLCGLIGNYVFMRIAPPDWAWAALWGGLMLIAWGATAVRIRMDSRQDGVSAPVGRMLGSLWGACGIAIIIICFIGIPLGVIPFDAISPTIASLVGIGVFITGVLMGTRWVRNLAVGWWVSAILEFIWHNEVQLLIFAIAIILLYIVPGFIMNAQARKFSSSTRA